MNLDIQKKKCLILEKKINMETLMQKHKQLEISVQMRLRAKILSKGVGSEHRSEKVLKVKDDQMFNLEGGRFLTEITPTELIDNEGYSYDHSSLELEQLCEAIDNA